MSSPAELRARLKRLIYQPSIELRRAWIYAKHRDRREAFIAFQQELGQRRATLVAGLRPNSDSILREPPVASDAVSRMRGENLRQLLIQHGSDKATTHDYDVIYTNFATLSGVPVHMVEIGLGTTGARASSMGSDGSPGASARAFRDWGASVVGADIDKSILVNEPGLRSYYVDQLIPRTLSELVTALEEPVDLAVIDGLHTPEADLNSLLALAPFLSRRGLLVVEDIENVPEITEVWQHILRVLPTAYKGALISTKASAVLLLVRADNPFVDDWSHIYPSAAKPIATSGRYSE